jgi:hypothetical protein
MTGRSDKVSKIMEMGNSKAHEKTQLATAGTWDMMSEAEEMEEKNQQGG